MKIVNSVFLIYWMLIFEGAFRKWFFPQFHEIIFFLRDPVVLLVYGIAWRHGFIERDNILNFGVILSLLFIPLIFIQLLVTKVSILTLIYGWRMYFFYLPLAFIIKDTFQHQDIHKLFRHTLIVAIPLSVLAYIQFLSPRNSFINSGYSGADAFVVTGTIVRTTGTFTFTSGQTMYAASLMAMLVFVWLYRKRYPLISTPWLIVSTAAAMTTLMVTGSRTAFFMTGLIVAATFLGLLLTRETKLKFTGAVLVAFLILIGSVMALGPLKDSFDAIGTRFQEAEASEGSPLLRAIAPLVAFSRHLTTAPIIGHGLGLTSGGGSKLATGKATWLLAEDEWSRVIVETGPGFGLIYILYRVVFTISLAKRCLRAASADNNVLPMILFGFIGFYLLAGQIASVGVFHGYTWLFVGILMAASQRQQTATMLINTRRTYYPKLVGSRPPQAISQGRIVVDHRG